MKRLLITTCVVILLETLSPLAAQTWTSSGPLPRVAHSAVFSQSPTQMIVFGGETQNTNSLGNLNDVWRLSFTSSVTGTITQWSQIKPTGTPPSERLGHAAEFDPATKRMMIFGGAQGHTSPCANDTWVLTNATGGTSAWIQLSPAGGPPPVRWGSQSAYDPTSNTLMIFGGNDCFATYYNDVWLLSNASGVGGTPTWTQLSVSGGPSARYNGTAIYDSTTNSLTVFGGSDGATGYFNDVWVLSNANGTGGTPAWTQLFPTGTPPEPRAYLSATYDPASNRMTIFGGFNNVSGVFGDTWVLTNANGTGGTPTWIHIAQSSLYFPAPRDSHTAVYNPTFNQMIVFGGGASTSFNDVFFLSHANGL